MQVLWNAVQCCQHSWEAHAKMCKWGNYRSVDIRRHSSSIYCHRCHCVTMTLFRSCRAEEASKSFLLVLQRVPRYASSSQRPPGQWQPGSRPRDPSGSSYWPSAQDNLLTEVTIKSMLLADSKRLYSSYICQLRIMKTTPDADNLRPPTVRVGESLTVLPSLHHVSSGFF